MSGEKVVMSALLESKFAESGSSLSPLTSQHQGNDSAAVNVPVREMPAAKPRVRMTKDAPLPRSVEIKILNAQNMLREVTDKL